MRKNPKDWRQTLRRGWLFIVLFVVAVFMVTVSINVTFKQHHQSSKTSQTTSTQSKKASPQAALKKASQETGNIAQLVNKTHPLPADYVPPDLVKVNLPSIRDTYLRKEAANALTQMFAAAKKDGAELSCSSGYRSYANQKNIYDQHVASMGAQQANEISSKPGQSEHQTGLTMDLTCSAMDGDLQQSFINTKEGKWVAAHAHEYGFIVRFPKGKEQETGYEYEPWHVRYLGKSLATKVYRSGLSYEAYLDRNNKAAKVVTSK